LALGPLPQPSDEEIRGGLREVFARPEFTSGGRRNWLLDWFLEALRWLGSLRQDNPMLYWILVVALSGLLLAILGHIVWTVRRAFGPGPEARAALEAAAERQQRSRAYRDEADRAAARRDFTEAVRYLFLSLVYRFDEQGRVGFQRAATNREYLTFFDDGRLRSDLGVFVDTLDLNWYGERPTEESCYRDCLQVYETMTNT
jgi:hypothetical protein